MLSVDLLSFPLAKGHRLIEASAGTGKTFTISNLYLRLLLGHSGEQVDFENPLTVEQIAVVTFTEAATAELKQRIYQRIMDVRHAFVTQTTEDPFICGLLLQIQDHKKAIFTLQQAEKQMDNAAIFTIHSFCAKILKDYAFSCHYAPRGQISTQQGPLLEQGAADFWRRSIETLAPQIAQIVGQWFQGPQDLLVKLGPCFNQTNVVLMPEFHPPLFEQSAKVILAELEKLKKLWRKDNLAINEQLNKVDFKKNIIKAPILSKHLQAMDRFAHSGKIPLSSLVYLCESRLVKAVKKGSEIPDHKVFAKIEVLVQLTDGFRFRLLQAAKEAMEMNLLSAKEQTQTLFFDDLLVNLAKALDNKKANGLDQVLRERYPFAMIDEFQDTNSLQYEIFSRIYPQSSQSALLMIGDPKQGIYAFRGADIATYLQAKSNIKEIYNLDTNWRTTKPLIAGINSLFAQDATIFSQKIPFIEVKAAGIIDKKPLKIKGESLKPLQFWLAKKPQNNQEEYLQLQAHAAAWDISRLLQLGQERQACLGDKPLTGKDCAVLVRSAKQAQIMRQALLEQGVACVYLSNQDSVFSTIQAQDILCLLEAIIDTQNETKLRAALSTSLLNWPLSQIEQLNRDFILLEEVFELFKGWQQKWAAHGIKPMLREILFAQDTAARLIVTGQRALTDFLHIAELLHEASLGLKGPRALIRWFNVRIEKPSLEPAAQLRLESDNNLVKIVTIHKSKGLEYPLVWLPFAGAVRKKTSSFYHQNEQLIYDLNPSDKAKKLAQEESCDEEMRLLYVAMTRAIYGCFIGVYQPQKPIDSLRVLEKNALGRLLNSFNQGQDSLNDLLAQVSINCPDVAIVTIEQQQQDLFLSQAVEKIPLKAKEFRGQIQKNWKITSYSQLTGQNNSGWQQREMTWYEAETQKIEDDFLPKGTKFGNLLHQILEDLDFVNPDFSLLPSLCFRFGFSESEQIKFMPQLKNLMQNIISTPFIESKASLANLSTSHYEKEMEFLLPSALLQANQLNGILAGQNKAANSWLEFNSVQGMLLGFIDLVFCYQGCYYVVDYKSNYLGINDKAYQAANLQEAILHHRYDLQSLLYLLALHRLLKARLPDYRYEQHLGGAYYLFARGLNGIDDSRGVWFSKPNYEIIDKLDQLLKGTYSGD